jgi:hypothetical protein
MCLRRSVAILPPTHFLTLHPGAAGTTDKAFSGAITKFLKALRRRSPGKLLEYLVVNEWKDTVRHAHALIRVGGSMSFRAMRRAVREAKVLADVRCSVERVRSVTGAANYLFKHTRRPERKAELAPETFRGKMYTVSKGFLVKPFKELWADVRRDRDAVRQAAASIAASQMRRADVTDAGSR